MVESKRAILVNRVKIIFLVTYLFSFTVEAGVASCGVVTIENLLTGPRHGAMMRVSNHSCGNGGWLCLDPNGEVMTLEESKLLFSFILANKMAGTQIAVTAYTDVYANSCGSYPVIEDARYP